jgi:ABC-type transport system involved in cytochrome bd biosynthesis fused ATPase/permease subunit
MDSEDMCSVKRIELPNNDSTSKSNTFISSSGNAAVANGSTTAKGSSSSSSSGDVPAVQISNGSFAWDAGTPPVLSDVSLAVPKGSLVIVVGPVGSGKSSLLSAVLGEMAAVGQQQQQEEEEERQQQQHPVTVAGSIAYTAQVGLPSFKGSC